ncbi:MAG: cytochrome P460 family protein [Xenococcaceae cyanobacterium MO_188.B29]|nr:cytochrome P460 family protein [Xenococcaceae cyanobacterium MO_188.B29]
MNCQKWSFRMALLLFSVAISLGLSRLVASESLEFPSNYEQDFVHYASVTCPNSRIVRQMYANPIAMNAARENNPLPNGSVIVMETHSAVADANGRLTPSHLNNVFIREKQSGFGQEHSENLRNGNWKYAWFSPTGNLVSNRESSCLSCHTRVSDRDYVFTLPDLVTAAQTNQLQSRPTKFGLSVCN